LLRLCWLCVCVFTVYIETYGCQMNVSDTEIAWSVLHSHGFCQATNIRDVSTLPSLFIHSIVNPASRCANPASRCANPAYSEPVSKPRNMEACRRKDIWDKNTSGCMAGLTLTVVCVAAAGLLVVTQ